MGQNNIGKSSHRIKMAEIIISNEVVDISLLDRKIISTTFARLTSLWVKISLEILKSLKCN